MDSNIFLLDLPTELHQKIALNLPLLDDLENLSKSCTKLRWLNNDSTFIQEWISLHYPEYLNLLDSYNIKSIRRLMFRLNEIYTISTERLHYLAGKEANNLNLYYYYVSLLGCKEDYIYYFVWGLLDQNEENINLFNYIIENLEKLIVSDRISEIKEELKIYSILRNYAKIVNNLPEGESLPYCCNIDLTLVNSNFSNEIVKYLAQYKVIFAEVDTQRIFNCQFHFTTYTIVTGLLGRGHLDYALANYDYETVNEAMIEGFDKLLDFSADRVVKDRFFNFIFEGQPENVIKIYSSILSNFSHREVVEKIILNYPSDRIKYYSSNLCAFKLSQDFPHLIEFSVRNFLGHYLNSVEMSIKLNLTFNKSLLQEIVNYYPNVMCDRIKKFLE